MNLKIIAMRRFLLEVKDQDHHCPNGAGKFNFWLISKAWNISGLFCIISGELILLIQCMKIRFTETFIKAFRVDLISREKTWSEKEIWSVSHCLSFSCHWACVPCLSLLWNGLDHCLYWACHIALVVKNLPATAGDTGDAGSVSGSRKIPWRRTWQPTPVFLPTESHEERSLEDERLQRVGFNWSGLVHTHFLCLEWEFNGFLEQSCTAWKWLSMLSTLASWPVCTFYAPAIFRCSKITADDDCSHETKRPLLLGRKVMTNIDSILKSRDITLPTKVHLVKVMFFPVVKYGCESWRKLSAEEMMLLNCGVGEDSWESLGLQGDPTSPS